MTPEQAESALITIIAGSEETSDRAELLGISYAELDEMRQISEQSAEIAEPTPVLFTTD